MNRTNKLQTSIQRLSFTITLCVLLQHCIAQITSGHVDDFQNLNTSGWTEGGVSPNPPVVISTGGPAGDGDAYLRNVSSGAIGEPGGKWVMFNQAANWIGNYLTAGVVEISMHVRNAGSQNVHLRLAFNGPGGAICSNAVFTVLPDTMWQSITFTIDPQIFIPLMAGGNAVTTLSAVNEFRILSNPVPNLNGEEIAATVDIDNIHAEGISATRETSSSAWLVYPNPATHFLQFSCPDSHKAVSVTLTDILGHVMCQENVQQPYLLDVSALQSGMYVLSIDRKIAIPVTIGSRF